MAYKKVRAFQYIADTKADLKSISHEEMGTECHVIKDGAEYMLMSTGEWVKQTKNNTADGSNIDLSNYPTKKELRACYTANKYKISETPKKTIIDYEREKEIRILCPRDTQFYRQSVGSGGDPNMCYMTFTCYAPEGAVALKEGDRGEIINELISLNGSPGTGIDEFGRRYKKHWFALASFDPATATWSYFGKNSTKSKYIGWSYIVEWYDKDGNIIDIDLIRINLSNENCHLTFDEYEQEFVEEMTIWETLPE